MSLQGHSAFLLQDSNSELYGTGYWSQLSRIIAHSLAGQKGCKDSSLWERLPRTDQGSREKKGVPSTKHSESGKSLPLFEFIRERAATGKAE